jgi:hypothetical protein
MPDSDSLTSITIGLWTCLGLLAVVLLLLTRVLSKLGKIESALLSPTRETSADPPTASESSSGGAFEAFLAEDSALRDLPKSEQFRAFRKWRQKNGMNWS